jgi:hypothetical protein
MRRFLAFTVLAVLFWFAPSARAFTFSDSRPIIPEATIADLSDVMPPESLDPQKCACIPATNPGMPANFFGLTAGTIGGGQDPTVNFGILRLWDTNAAGWFKSSNSCGTPDFTNLDAWLARANVLGVQVMWTAGRTPSCAITGGAGSCTGTYAPNGCAQPPSDIATTDLQWKNFVTALVTHSLTQTPHIKYYECVNEFDLLGEWTDNAAHLVTMCGDMAAIVHANDASAVVLGPSSSTGNRFGVHGYTSLQGGTGYIAAGGNATYDAMNLHAYIQSCSVWCTTPEGIGGSASGIVEYIQQAKLLTTKPIYFSEGSWGCGSGNTITDALKTSYLLREYMYMYDAGLISYVWYTWDNNGAPLGSTCGTLAPSDVIGPAGTAYATIQTFLIGSTHVIGSCVHPVALQTWTCDLVLTGGIPATIIWNPSTPTAVSLTGGRASYVTQVNLKDGTTAAIVAHSVTADVNPILVQ